MVRSVTDCVEEGTLVNSLMPGKKIMARPGLRRILFAATAVAATLALPSPSVSAGEATLAYPPVINGPLVFVYPNSPTVTAGTQFTVTVLGCESGKPVAVTFNPTVNANCVNGRATATFRAPCKAGVYPISAVVRGQTSKSYVTVTGSCDGIPSTGIASLSTALSLGLGTLATGIVLFIAARSRHRLRLTH